MTSATTINQQTTTNPIDRFLGGRLRIFRDARRMTQGQLGKKIGVSADGISKYENGQRGIDMATLWKLAVALDVDLQQFWVGFPTAERLPRTTSWLEVTLTTLSAPGNPEQHYHRVSKTVTDPERHYQICELVGLGATPKRSKDRP